MKHWEGKSVAVTGAGGFIGSHLTEKLLGLGASVTAFVRYNSRGDEGFLKLIPTNLRKNLETLSGDLTDVESGALIFKGRKIDVVFNLAAKISIPYSYTHPQEVVDNNLTSTLNILLASRDANVNRFVQTSTSEVYGSAQFVPINEAHPKQPQSPYSASKIATDAIALSFHYTYGLPVSIVRPFNAYGPRQSARAVIPSVIIQALTQDEILVGTTTTTRDFTFVSDLVEGFLKVGESENAVGEEINVGSGVEVSIKDTIARIVDVCGRDVRIRNDEARVRPEKSEVQRLLADNRKARSLVGWKPKVNFRDGLKRTVDWIRGHISDYDPGRYNV